MATTGVVGHGNTCDIIGHKRKFVGENLNQLFILRSKCARFKAYSSAQIFGRIGKGERDAFGSIMGQCKTVQPFDSDEIWLVMFEIRFWFKILIRTILKRHMQKLNLK